MSKRKKQQKKAEMTLEQKIGILKVACVVLTAVITCVLLALFF